MCCLVVGPLCVGEQQRCLPSFHLPPISNQIVPDSFVLLLITVDSDLPFWFLIARAPRLQFSLLFRILAQPVYLIHLLLYSHNNRATIVCASVIH